MTAKETLLLKSLFAKDEDGKHYLRVVKGAPKKLSNALNPQSGTTLETLLAKSIVLDKDGNPALSLAEVEFSAYKGDVDAAKREKARKTEEARVNAQQKKYRDANKKATNRTKAAEVKAKEAAAEAKEETE